MRIIRTVKNVSEASRDFMDKKQEYSYLKNKINKLAIESKNTKIRNVYIAIHEFNYCYQHQNINKDQNIYLLADSQNILNRWKNYSQLLNVHSFSNIRQIKIYTAEVFVPEPSPFEI
jgi:hypothetical protein